MSHKLRSVNTKFWDDPFICELTPTEKLLFLYLITNSLTNLIGIYEISMRKISFDTGLNSDVVKKGLERFETVKKVFYFESFIILPNWLKNQNLNSNMRIAVEKEYNQLPNSLKKGLISDSFESDLNDYQTIRNHLETIRDINRNRIESEVEIEDEFNWKKNFEVYKNDLRENYNSLISDSNFIETQEKYFPGVDIILSIEKACVNFWATEAGWKHKIKERTNKINWKQTLTNAISLNKVYKPTKKDAVNEKGETYFQMLDRVAKGG